MIGQEQESKSTGANGSGNNDDRTNRSERDGSENHTCSCIVLLEIFCCIYIFIINLMTGGIMVFKCKADKVTETVKFLKKKKTGVGWEWDWVLLGIGSGIRLGSDSSNSAGVGGSATDFENVLWDWAGLELFLWEWENVGVNVHSHVTSL